MKGKVPKQKKNAEECVGRLGGGGGGGAVVKAARESIECLHSAESRRELLDPSVQIR